MMVSGVDKTCSRVDDDDNWNGPLSPRLRNAVNAVDAETENCNWELGNFGALVLIVVVGEYECAAVLLAEE